MESRLVHHRLFVSANPFHPKDVRELFALCTSTGADLDHVTITIVYLSNPKPGHTTGGSGRARRSDRAGSGKIGCQQNYSPKKQRSTVPSQASKKRRFNDSPEARTSEILCKPIFVSANPSHPKDVRELHPFRIGFTRFHSQTRRLHSWHICLPKPKQFTEYSCAGTNKGIPM